MVKVLGLVGSIRKNSYNKSLMLTAREVKPESMQIEVFDLSEIPPFNGDFERQPPKIVKDLKDKIKASDALLIATPEYNYSIPGILKNSIDWASRPYGDNSFNGKPVAIMSASTGMLGGARAQYHLRQCFVFLNMFPINRPEVIVVQAAKQFDENGNLTNQETRDHIKQLLESLSTWTKQLSCKP